MVLIVNLLVKMHEIITHDAHCFYLHCVKLTPVLLFPGTWLSGVVIEAASPFEPVRPAVFVCVADVVDEIFELLMLVARNREQRYLLHLP